MSNITPIISPRSTRIIRQIFDIFIFARDMRFDPLNLINPHHTLYESKCYFKKCKPTKFCKDPLKTASSAPGKVMSRKSLISILISAVIYNDSA